MSKLQHVVSIWFEMDDQNIDDTDESNFNLNDENVIEEIELNDTEDGKMIAYNRISFNSIRG